MAALLACICMLFSQAAAAAPQYTLDLDYIRTVAPDAVAWLYQPGTTIDQPVVYSADSKYYLRRGFNQQNNSGKGAVYITGDEAPDLSAPIVTLRGANRLNNTLFGSLSEYKEDAYYQQHPTLYFITPDGQYQLDIFAGVRTTHGDTESWVVTEDTRNDMLPALLERSFIKPDTAFLPAEDDSWVILTTESRDDSGTRFVIYTRRRALSFDNAAAVPIHQREMDARETLSGPFTVEGVGTWMIYGQNDPLWKRLIFEVDYSSRQRPFGDGGCGPTAIAMAIANMVEPEELPLLAGYSSEATGYCFCACCIGDRWCHSGHIPYKLTEAGQFLRYFPLAVAEFAMGNNVFEVQGRYDSFGTSMSYLEAICSVYGIQTHGVSDFNVALDFLRRENTIAIACATGTPFTRTSHFLVMAHVDDEYLYVLDPLRRESYGDMDANGFLEILTPGLVRIRLENAPYCRLSGIILLTRYDELPPVRRLLKTPRPV